jgi:glycosyltransferase involved in cell wall biosynthesis
VKELKKRGKQVFLMDGNYKKEFGEYLKDCYDPIDVKNDEYVTIINQPPPRWPKSYGYKNLVGYLAFEGELNDEWVKIINESPIKELWTPSNYCKKMFTKSGVTKPIWVIPHGVDPDLWVSKKVDDEEFLKLKENGEFVFLASGTYQNNRKGFDLLARAFSEEFGPDEKVKLVFKINKIYNPNDNFSRYIKQFVNQTGNTRIEYVDKDLSPERLVDLYNSVDVFVSPHRAEGFGINILNALAIGLPVITTGATGNMDFCNKDNCLLIDVGANPVWSDFIPPYENSKWEKPSIDSLKRNLRKTYNDYGFFKKRAEKVKKQIRKEWTWKDTVDKIEERVKTLFC